MHGVYGFTEKGLIVPCALAEVKVDSANADIVLDPVCGSGTTARAASDNCRRFICIDLSPDAIDITWRRLHWAVKQRTVIVHFALEKKLFLTDPMLWDSGCNFLVLGDCVDVMRTMPDSFVALIYADPPFNSNREYRNKEGLVSRTFGDGTAILKLDWQR